MGVSGRHGLGAAALLMLTAQPQPWAQASLPAEAPAPAQKPVTGGSFHEDFTSDRLDPARWYVSDGWSNGEHQLCVWSRDHVRLEGGALQLVLEKAQRGGRDYACGEIQTQAFHSFGVYEARIRPSKGPGVVSALFTYTGPTHGTQHDEIDIEFVGKRADAVEMTHWVDGKADGGKVVELGLDASRGYRDYAFEWAPDRLRWFVDGQLVHEVTAARGPIPQTPSKLFLSLWNGNNEAWLGKFADAGRPLTMHVDWVAFTAAGEGCRFPASLLCRQGRRAADLTSPAPAAPKPPAP